MNLIIRDLPEELLVRLRRRAEQSGHSVEQEALDILFDSIEQHASALPNEPFAAALSRRMAEIGLSNADWQELDRSLDAARQSRSDSIHRWIDFANADFGQ